MADQPPELFRKALLLALQADTALDQAQRFREWPRRVAVPYIRVLRGQFTTRELRRQSSGSLNTTGTVDVQWTIAIPMMIVQNSKKDTLESAIITLLQTPLAVTGFTVRTQWISEGEGDEILTRGFEDEDEDVSELDVNILTVTLTTDKY